MEGVERAQTTTEAVTYQQLLSMMEMSSSNRHNMPETRGNVGEEPPAKWKSAAVI